MNVASTPLRWATPLTMRLNRIAWSQACRASWTCRRFTSHWFGPHSASAAPVGTPCASQVAPISPRMSETDSSSAIELTWVRRLAPSRVARSRRLGVALGRALAIDEVELELDRDDRLPAARGIAIEHGVEDVPRIAVKRPAIVVEHLHLELRDARAHPRRGVEGIRDGHAGPVGIALVKPEAGRLDRAAEDVERKHRSGQEHAALVHAGKVGPVHALAAQHAAEIGEQKIHDPHRGTRGEESLGIRMQVPDEGHSSPGRLRSCIARRSWPRGRITSPPCAGQGSCGAT